MWNYGALPQTWEDPDHTDSLTKYDINKKISSFLDKSDFSVLEKKLLGNNVSRLFGLGLQLR